MCLYNLVTLKFRPHLRNKKELKDKLLMKNSKLSIFPRILSIKYEFSKAKSSIFCKKKLEIP